MLVPCDEASNTLDCRRNDVGHGLLEASWRVLIAGVSQEVRMDLVAHNRSQIVQGTKLIDFAGVDFDLVRDKKVLLDLVVVHG